MEPYEIEPGTETRVTEEDLNLLKSESEILDGGDAIATADRLFKENLAQAVLNIVKLSSNAGSDRVRLDASKYIVERNMGRLQDININLADPLEKFAELLQEDTP